MKKLFVLLLVLFSLVSCKSLPERFEVFVSEVEMNYATYSEVDWVVMDQKCAEFKAEFVEKYDKLSPYEKEYMNKAFGRYDAAVTRSKINEAASGVKRFIEGAGHYLEGLVEGISGVDTTATNKAPAL